MGRFGICIIAIVGIMTLTDGAPHPHHHNDPYSPVIDFLKQLRKARKHSGGGLTGNREEEGTQGSSSSSISFQEPQTEQQQQNQQVVPILFPSQSSSSQSSGSGNDQRLPPSIQIPNLPSISITPRPSSPADIQRVNSGVSTILEGVKSFDLGQILRGAFIFPRNENVKSVANTVLDSIFGQAGAQSPSSQN